MSYSKKLTKSCNKSNSFENSADLLVASNQPEKAEEEFSKALVYFPGHKRLVSAGPMYVDEAVQLHMKRANVRIELGYFWQALIDFKEILRLLGTETPREIADLCIRCLDMEQCIDEKQMERLLNDEKVGFNEGFQILISLRLLFCIKLSV